MKIAPDCPLFVCARHLVCQVTNAVCYASRHRRSILAPTAVASRRAHDAQLRHYLGVTAGISRWRTKEVLGVVGHNRPWLTSAAAMPAQS